MLETHIQHTYPIEAHVARRHGTRVVVLLAGAAALLPAWGFDVVVGDATAARLAARGSLRVVGDADGRVAAGRFADVGDADGAGSYCVVGNEDGP